MLVHPTPEEADRYGLSALPDELRELHIEAASLEVNPLWRTLFKVRFFIPLLPFPTY
jgi:hypothetical protein